MKDLSELLDLELDFLNELENEKEDLIDTWWNAYIEDKNGNIYFNNICTYTSLPGVKREIQRHLNQIGKNKGYKFLEGLDCKMVVKQR